MKKENLKPIIYVISFILVWVSYIFWFEKNEFDLEFKEKMTKTATIFNIGTDEAVEELYDGRKVNVHEINYIEYSYSVKGKKYKSGSTYDGKTYSISDKIEIEYVKSNPSISKIKGQNEYSFNYFVRNLISVSLISLVVMYCTLGILEKKMNKNKL